MTSGYDEIFSRFLLKVESYKILSVNAEVVEEMKNGWIASVISRPYVRRLFSSISRDDDSQEIQYELRNSVSEADDKDFVEELFARGMMIEWLTPQVNSELSIAQMFSGKEVNFFSQASHLKEIKSLLESEDIGFRKFIRDRGYSLTLDSQ